MKGATSTLSENKFTFIERIVNKLKRPLLIASAISSVAMMGTANSASAQPAVANINGWVDAAVDYMDNNFRNGAAGGFGNAGVAVPFTHDFASQLHLFAGSFGKASLQSIDGLFFWRNPALGLLGPHITYNRSGLFYSTLYGLHGEYYFNNWTFAAEGGGISRKGRDSSGYGQAVVSWYGLPDWRVYVAGKVIDDNGGGELGTEYQLGLKALPALSIFADIGGGNHNLWYGFLGLRYYLGDPCNPCKQLIQRHREDMVPPSLQVVGTRHNLMF
jgi:hypothetical protein